MIDRLQPKSLYYYSASMWKLFWNSNWWSVIGIIMGRTVLFKTKLGAAFWSRRLMDLWTIKEVVMDDVYRLNWIKIKKGDVVIDIGAATGDFSIIAARRGAVVYAYEPDPDRLELLGMNMLQNRVNSISVGGFAAESLDDIFDKRKIRSCKLLKVDCEGCEYRIFSRASKKTLKKISNLAMEVHLFDSNMQRDFSDLKSKLINNDFEITVLDNQVHRNVKYLFASK